MLDEEVLHERMEADCDTVRLIFADQTQRLQRGLGDHATNPSAEAIGLIRR